MHALHKNILLAARQKPPAEAIQGSTKYGPTGRYNPEDFSHLPADLAAAICESANHAVTKSTWSVYNTAVNLLNKCKSDVQTLDFSFPLTEEACIAFCGWLIKRGLKAGTIESYLAGLRAAHLAQGLSCSTLRSPLINQIINGRKNQPLATTGKNRLPATPTIMKIIKSALKNADLHKKRKLTIWAVCSIAFSGAFRAGELLTKYSTYYDPIFTLLKNDIREKSLTVNGSETRILQIQLKSEKCNKSGKATWIDLYQSDNFLCPVKAYGKYKRSNSTDLWKPAFLDEEGRHYTTRLFNADLKLLTQPGLDHLGGQISGHSFRAGLASMLGHLGFTDEEVKSSGRWSSRAFETYFKLPRTKRAEMARKISQISM